MTGIIIYILTFIIGFIALYFGIKIKENKNSNNMSLILLGIVLILIASTGVVSKIF